MAKVLLLNGSPHVSGCTARALEEMVKIFTEEGVETELIQVGSKPVRGRCGERQGGTSDHAEPRPQYGVHDQIIRG